MSKNKTGNLILLAGLGIGAYLLYKTFFSGQQTTTNGGYTTGWIPGDQTPQTPMNQDENTPTTAPTVPVFTPTAGKEPLITITPTTGDIVVTPIQTPIQRPLIQYTIQDVASKIVNTITIPAPIGVTAATVAANNTAQNWTAATYGQPGQPSVAFLKNTLTAAATTKAPTTTKTAAAAIAAAAPPRIVAKIKAGSAY